jgi:predicted 2-oxoglutarate/Fe(II)-dependent dioxygenase YbiX
MAIKINGFFPGEVQPTTVVGGSIAIFKKILPSPEILIEMAEQECNDPDSGIYWERAGTVNQGAFQAFRTNKLLSVSFQADINNNSVLQTIHNQFYMMLLATSIPYARQFGIQEELWHENYCLLKYNEGEEYKKHYDGGTALGRSISAICYLNDDYEGGEIEFTNFGIKIKPEAGTLILFPSSYPYAHIAHPVTKGTKYALVTWIRDQKFI